MVDLYGKCNVNIILINPPVNKVAQPPVWYIWHTWILCDMVYSATFYCKNQLHVGQMVFLWCVVFNIKLHFTVTTVFFGYPRVQFDYCLNDIEPDNKNNSRNLFFQQ